MKIGLSTSELFKLFDNTYQEEIGKSLLPSQKVQDEYEAKLIPENIARELAELTVRQIAARKAMLKVIETNNARVQAQLEQKGLLEK